MHPRARRLLGWFFILVFFLVTPVLILSTAGYRYNFTKKKLERTGVLFVDSVPDDASIVLSGQPRKERTPARISRLLPGTYDVRLERPGFRSWQKRAEIWSNTTTFFADVALFRDALPILAHEATPTHVALSPDARYAAVVSESEAGYELNVFDTRTGRSALAYRAQGLADLRLRLDWSPDSRRLLISIPRDNDVEYLLWSVGSTERPVDAAEIMAIRPTQAFWSEDGRTLYASDATGLYGWDVRGEEVASLGPSGAGASVANGRVYAIGTDDAGFALMSRGVRDEAFAPLARLNAGDYRPVPGFGRRIVYASASTGRMLILNPEPSSEAPSGFETRGTNGTWSPDGKLFLYWNDFELHQYDAERDTDTLLTRVGTPIIGAQWVKGANALVYATATGLYAVEARGGADRVMTPLAEFGELTDLMLNRAGDTAILAGRIGRQSGIWTLPLR